MAERPITLDHLRSQKKPSTAHVDICLEPDLAEAVEIADAAVSAAELNARPVGAAKVEASKKRALEDARAVHDSALATAKEATVRFRFRSIGRKKFEDLQLAHPSTAEQKALADDEENAPTWNVDTFPQALVAASLVDPALTGDEVKVLFEDDAWSATELLMLWTAALTANTRTRIVDLGNA